MAQEQSIIKKGENAINDFLHLWRRRKLICIVIIIVLLIPAIFSVANSFWGRGQLNDRIVKLESELTETKRDRDARAAQLAPFLAIANQRFENAPPDKRLDLLLDRIEKLTTTVQDSMAKLQSRRSLSAEAIARIVGKLNSSPHLDVEVGGMLGDMESLGLANQIKSAFEQSGFKVRKLAQYLPQSEPIYGVSIYFKEKPKLGLINATGQVFTELGQPLAMVLAPNLIGANADPANPPDIKIVVGAK